MPRQARIDAPGALQHIICRGIERSRIFTDGCDRKDFLARLEAILSDTSTVCYAWALIPNHFHLLLRTGPTPISTVMRRLLTGYAVAFNHRHRRSGHLFQNRYKSILCQDDPYLLELIRYIHLNPLRAGLVGSMDALAAFPDSGHRQLLGLEECGFVSADEVLSHFDKRRERARKKYATFVAEGAKRGNRPELSGGGLARSLSGLRKNSNAPPDKRMAWDERILGEGDFVESVLREADVQHTICQRCRAVGFGLEELRRLVAELLEIDPSQVGVSGKQPDRVRARSLYCYWAVRELGFTATTLGRELGLSQPAVSQAVRRGEVLAAQRGVRFGELLNLESYERPLSSLENDFA